MNGVIQALGGIVVLESFSESVRRNSNDRVLLRIEGLRPPECMNGDAVFLYIICFPGEVTLCDKLQKMLEVGRFAQHSRMQKSLHLMSFLLFFQRREWVCHSHVIGANC